MQIKLILSWLLWLLLSANLDLGNYDIFGWTIIGIKFSACVCVSVCTSASKVNVVIEVLLQNVLDGKIRWWSSDATRLLFDFSLFMRFKLFLAYIYLHVFQWDFDSLDWPFRLKFSNGVFCCLLSCTWLRKLIRWIDSDWRLVLCNCFVILKNLCAFKAFWIWPFLHNFMGFTI